MTAISNIVCIYKLDNIVNKYNNIYHSTIKMKPVDAKSKTLCHGHRLLMILKKKELLELFTKINFRKKKQIKRT